MESTIRANVGLPYDLQNIVHNYIPFSGICTKTLTEHKGSIFALTVLKDDTLVIGFWDGTIKLWI